MYLKLIRLGSENHGYAAKDTCEVYYSEEPLSRNHFKLIFCGN